MADEFTLPGITLETDPLTLPGTVVGGTNPIDISAEVNIGGFGGGNAPPIGEFGINVGGQLGGNPPYQHWSTTVEGTPAFEEFLTTAEGMAWRDTHDRYKYNHTFYNPLIVGARLSPGGPDRTGGHWADIRGFYDQQLAYHQGVLAGPTEPPPEIEETQTTEASIMSGLFDWFAPDTPGNQGAIVAESEDQWWDAPLEAVGDLVRPIAQHWINRGIEELYDWSMPGRTGGGTSPGFPQHPGSNQIIDVTPTHREAPMAQVPTSLPGGASVPVSQQSGNLAGAPWCITPGGAQIRQRQGTTMRLPSTVDVPTVDRSGNVRYTTFKNMGRPVLYSGDYAAAKRVTKVASKARRRRGGR